MSSFDKVVKLACKPKAAPPKAKYLEPIIAATWSEDGAVHDVCKALSPRFREPNSIVVFKALLVLHTMIRNGATDNVLSYLSSSDVLRLRNITAGNWDGFAVPENIQHYALYLDSRIRAYHDLKHDAVRVQSESNRDMRNSQSIEEDTRRSRSNKKSAAIFTPSGPTRSKTIMGRKLRVMTVEKGLLRETKAVHRMIDALVECRFYMDDLEDELTTMALQMLVKDLLILFQAGNEGVINVLEHYFEMSRVDAEQALAIYRHFCKQTERVVEFLGVAKKLQNLISVPIPNLKHAPVSLAGALQEYLEDPNFDQNRIEYKTNKEAARNNKSSSRTKGPETSTISEKPPLSTPTPKAQPVASTSAPASTAPKGGDGKDVDFFSSIEEQQPTMFNPHTNSPNSSYFQNQSTFNPFNQIQMTTGQPFMLPNPQIPQQTGFIQAQQTAYQQSPPNPFGSQVPQQQSGHRPFSAFLPQATGVVQNQPQPHQSPSFLQPQAIGANPFRQSMLAPQSTGMALFGGAGMGSQGNPSASPHQSNGTGLNAHAPFTSTGMAFSTSSSVASPFAQSVTSRSTAPGLPARPSSTPLTSIVSTSSATSPPAAQPVKTHQTGTRNPFGPITTPPPPMPRQPTLMELGSGIGGNSAVNAPQPGQHQYQPSQQPSAQQQSFGGYGFNSAALSPGATDISSVASSFAFNKTNGSATTAQHASLMDVPQSGAFNAHNTATTNAGSAPSDSLFSSSLSNQPTGVTNPSLTSNNTNSLKPQLTGFAGLKPFKPSSSFGASLLESLPPIPGSLPGTPALNGHANGATSSSGGGLSSPGTGTQMPGMHPSPQFLNGGFGNTGSTLGQGLRPQMTGAAVNPFRASMMVPSAGGAPNIGGNHFTSFTPNGSSTDPSLPATMAFGSGFTSVQSQRQQIGPATLI